MFTIFDDFCSADAQTGLEIEEQEHAHSNYVRLFSFSGEEERCKISMKQETADCVVGWLGKYRMATHPNDRFAFVHPGMVCVVRVEGGNGLGGPGCGGAGVVNQRSGEGLCSGCAVGGVYQAPQTVELQRVGYMPPFPDSLPVQSDKGDCEEREDGKEVA